MSKDPAREPSSHFYMSQRLRLHYADWGNRDAPPLVLLHGGLDHSRNWDWVAERLCDRYHVIVPDLRGHGDSQWSPDGHYSMAAHVYDLAQLIDQLQIAPARIIGHSLGGNIALRYTGLYPANVEKLVAIEGLGPSAEMESERQRKGAAERLREWMGKQKELSARQPKRYASVEQALARMMEQNANLSDAQARHLTIHGLSRNEDGSYSWKYDNYSRSVFPNDVSPDELRQLWANISCPTLLVYGQESWASNPETDGRSRHFRNARVSSYEKAGHWVHHDQLEAFVAEAAQFLS